MCKEHAQDGEARLLACPGDNHEHVVPDHRHEGDAHPQLRGRVAEIEGAQEHEVLTGERVRSTSSQA